MMNFFNEQFLPQGFQEARKWIVMPRSVNLHEGQVLYRFYDSKRSLTPQAGMNGPWWVEYEYFQKIKHFALQHDYSLSYSARLFAAILYEWSEVDTLVRCRLNQPIKALKGRGKQITGDGNDSRDLSTMTPMQSVLEIYQLYLPGVGGKDSIADSVFTLVGSERI